MGRGLFETSEYRHMGVVRWSKISLDVNFTIERNRKKIIYDLRKNPHALMLSAPMRVSLNAKANQLIGGKKILMLSAPMRVSLNAKAHQLGWLKNRK